MSKKKTYSPRHIVLTVGHSNRRLEDFLRLLQEHEVTLLADIRRFACSRSNPQFNADTLQKALGAIDVSYIHLPALGGRRRPQPDSPNAAWKNASFRGYADYMLTPEFEVALQDLIERFEGQRAALMCAEALPWRCHRSLVAEALVARGMTVQHILSPSRVQTHVPRPWAHVEGTRITFPAP